MMVTLCALTMVTGYAQRGVGYADNWWRPNGVVNASVRVGNTLYLGGTFDVVEPQEPYGICANNSTAAIDFSYLNPNGPVYAVETDGAGGWYIGGDFTKVGNVTRKRIARINADGSIHPWAPNVSNEVKVLKRAGSKLFLAGNFTTITGLSRVRLASFDTGSATPTSWNPAPDLPVNDMEVVGNTLYVVGKFNMMAGQVRYKLAYFDLTTGNLINSSYEFNNEIYYSEIYGNTMYLIGAFTMINWNISRRYCAAINLTTGAITPFNLNLSGSSNWLSRMLIAGNKLYLTGNFTNILNTPRTNSCAINLSTVTLTPWRIGGSDTAFPVGSVNTMHAQGNKIFIGGEFQKIAGQERKRLAVVDTSTGNLLPWTANLGGVPNAILSQGTRVYIGGNFQGVNGVSRSNLASIDVTTGQPTNWNPEANNSVTDISAFKNRIYTLGIFTQLNGQTRRGLASFDTATGGLTTWDPAAVAITYPSRMTFSDSLIYVGGNYNPASPTSNQRVGLMAFNLNTSALNPMSINIGPANRTIGALCLKGNTLYVSGTFESVNGSAREMIAAVHATTGALLPWNPIIGVPYNNFPYGVSEMALSDTTMFIAGNFSSINGQPRKNLAEVGLVGGGLTSFSASTDTAVTTLTRNGSNLYIGGFFKKVGDSTRNGLAAIRISTGRATAWNPNVNLPENVPSYTYGTPYWQTLRQVRVFQNTIYASGGFAAMDDNSTRRGVMALTDFAQVPTISSFTPTKSSVGGTITINGNAFTGATAVNIGGVPATSYSIVNNSTITAVVGNASAGNVTVTNPYGTGSRSGFILLNPPSITSLNPATSYCPGDSVTITFSATNYDAGNVFTAQLSSSAGNFNTVKNIGTFSGASGGTFKATIPSNQSAGTGYRIRIISSSPAINGPANTVNLAVNALPATTSVTLTPSANPSICAGSSVSLSVPANNALTFQWQKDSLNISGATANTYSANASGIYRVRSANASGCTRTSVNRTVTVNPMPVATFADSTLSNGNRFLTATQTPPAQYQWHRNGTALSGATARTYTATQSGNYHVVVTRNGCTTIGTAVTITLTNGNRLAIGADEALQAALTLYPNPASGAATLSAPADADAIWHISVRDVSGRMVESHSVAGGAAIRIGENLPTGFYTVEATSGSQRILQNWVKQ